ncbi:MAG: hypothetical protein BWK77_05185 [Verrucomicrobia bacterium A1]|nr:MAG: hypothetical protein BWK77_05185 [Verrucomicrobia bacterium A1]
MSRRCVLCALAGASWLFGCLLFGALPGAARAADDSRAAVTSVTQAPYYWTYWGWSGPVYARQPDATAVERPGLGIAGGEEWYERLHSEERVKAMADVGISLAVTHFYWGLGLESEREDQQRTAELVKLAHKHGIKVLGYCKSGSSHYALVKELPEPEKWISRWSGGKLKIYDYKPAESPNIPPMASVEPCILSPEWLAYMKRAIRIGLEDIGLDGFHFDNTCRSPCYCERCQRAFREWLVARHSSPRKLGLNSFDEARLPLLRTPSPEIRDPLEQEWVRFRCHIMAEHLDDLARFARSIRPEVILLHNPGWPRRLDQPYRLAMWMPLQSRHFTLVWAENGNSARMSDDVLISQIRAYKEAAAVGFRAVSTTWKGGVVNASGLPQTPEEVGLQVAEAAANKAAVPGANWALRPDGKGDRMRIDRPELREALAKSLRFVRGNEKLLAGGRPVRDIAVFKTFDSMAFNSPEAGPLVSGVEESLIRSGFSWEMVFGEDLRRLDGFTTIILAGQSHLSNKECEAIRAFVKRGGNLILVGDNGRHDENGCERSPSPFEGLDENRVARVEADAVRSTVSVVGLGEEVRVLLPKGWKQLADAIERVAGSRLSVRLEFPGSSPESPAIERVAGSRLSVRLRGANTVAVSGYELDGNRLAVHLVNYAPAEQPKDLCLELGGRWEKSRAARLLTVDGSERNLRVRRDPQPRLELPPLGVYTVLIVE